MAVLKQIRFGDVATPIAKSVVAINANSTNALSVAATNDQLTDNADPTYTIALAVDGQTITMPSGGLKTALALKFEAASGSGEGATPARIVLADQNGASGYNVLSSVPVSDLVGSGMVESASYNASTGELTIEWVGSGADTVIDLGALLDIQDIVIKSDSTDFLSFAAIDPGTETGGQAQIGVKLADVTYTAADTSGSTPVPANLTVDTTNGKILDASDAIPAIKSYVDATVTAASSVTAAGDNYITAAQDAQDSMKINVSADVQSLTATAGTPGTYGTDGSQTTAPTHGSLSGTADSLADGADIATKVKTYVDGEIAIEAARSDAKNKADIKTAIEGLDNTDTAVTGQVVTAVSTADGIASPTKANLAGVTLGGFTQDATATGAIANTDTLGDALNKLENGIEAAASAASAAHSVVEHASGNTHVTVSASQPDSTTGAVTYTVSETNIADADDLTDEIAARKAVDGQSGDTYAANSGTNYISSATSLNNADVLLDTALKAEETRAKSAETAIDSAVGLTKGANDETRTYTNTGNYIGKSATNTLASDIKALDTQLKAVSDAAAGIQYQVSGTTLEFFGIDPYSA